MTTNLEWYPPEIALDYWEKIMEIRWDPYLSGGEYQCYRQILSCVKYLRENPPTLANKDFRLRILGYLRYARWSLRWEIIHGATPEKYMLLKAFAPYIIGAASVAAAVYISHNWVAARQRSDETVLQLLEQIDSFAGEYPLDSDLYRYFLPFLEDKDLPETFLGSKPASGLGGTRGYQMFIPARGAQTFHYAASSWQLDPIMRKNVLLLVFMKLHNNALPRRLALTLHIPTFTGNIMTTLALFNPPQGPKWVVEVLPSTQIITVLPELGEWKGFQYYFLNIDLHTLQVTDLLIQNWLETELHIPISHYQTAPVDPPFFRLDITSEINRPARIELDRILVANWGPPFVHAYIPPQNLKDPPDFDVPPQYQPDKHPSPREKFDYKFFPSAPIPGAPQPWDKYRPPWIKKIQD